MLLSILTSCHNPSHDDLPSPTGPFYVKASSKNSAAARAESKKRKKIKRASVTIGTPSGFKHEFHLGRDVNSSSELWDLEQWRTEIERRVQQAAAEHAAINAAAASLEEEKRSKPRPPSMIKRKPVPSLDLTADSTTVSASTHDADGVVMLDSAPSSSFTTPLTSTTPNLVDSPGPALSIDLPEESTPPASSLGHSSDEEDAVSVESTIPPITPPQSSPRASQDYKHIQEQRAQLAPIVELATPTELVDLNEELRLASMDVANGGAMILSHETSALFVDLLVKAGAVHDSGKSVSALETDMPTQLNETSTSDTGLAQT